MYRGSWPPASIRASQYSVPSTSLPRTALCSAEMRLKCSSPLLSDRGNRRCSASAITARSAVKRRRSRPYPSRVLFPLAHQVLRRRFERLQGAPGIPVGFPRQQRERVVVDPEV